MTQHPLISLLREEQGSTIGSSFARRLGVSDAAWSRITRGLNEPSGDVYIKAILALPHRRDEILDIYRRVMAEQS